MVKVEINEIEKSDIRQKQCKLIHWKRLIKLTYQCFQIMNKKEI